MNIFKRRDKKKKPLTVDSSDTALWLTGNYSISTGFNYNKPKIILKNDNILEIVNDSIILEDASFSNQCKKRRTDLDECRICIDRFKCWSE